MAVKGSSSRIALKLAVVAILIAALVVWAMNAFQTTVVVAPVTKGDVSNVVGGSVAVRAEKEQPVESEIAGRISVSNLAQGKFVKEEEELLVLDQTEISIDLSQINGALEAAMKQETIYKDLNSASRISLASKEASLKTMESDLKAGRAKPEDVEKLRADVQNLKETIALEEIRLTGEISTLKSKLLARTHDLNRTTIRANFDGEIAEVFAFKGGGVTARTPLATLISTGRIYEAKISQEQFASIKLGQQAKVRFSGKNDIYDATVGSILPTADPKTQLYTIQLKLTKEPDDVLRPGLTGTVDISVGEHKGVTRVPKSAVQFGEVFVVSGGKVESRAVKLGFQNLNFAEVTEGVSVGEIVVVDRTAGIRNGQRVKIDEGASK